MSTQPTGSTVADDGDERVRCGCCILGSLDTDTATATGVDRTRAPTTRVARIPGAGHAVHRDQFDPYMEAVQAFLRETVAS